MRQKALLIILLCSVMFMIYACESEEDKFWRDENERQKELYGNLEKAQKEGEEFMAEEEDDQPGQEGETPVPPPVEQPVPQDWQTDLEIRVHNLQPDHEYILKLYRPHEKIKDWGNIRRIIDTKNNGDFFGKTWFCNLFGVRLSNHDMLNVIWFVLVKDEKIVDGVVVKSAEWTSEAMEIAPGKKEQEIDLFTVW